MSMSIKIIIEETMSLLKNKGSVDMQINEHTEFLSDQVDMDSLDLATLIVSLEEKMGFDPFRDGFKEFKTVGELAALYDNK